MSRLSRSTLQPELLALPPVPKARKLRSDAKPMHNKKVAQPQAELAWSAPGLIAGVDEAGRGPLAGNVVAAAVILDDLNPIKGLNDSKAHRAAPRKALCRDSCQGALRKRGRSERGRN